MTAPKARDLMTTGMVTVPPDMPDLGIDKAWRIQCDMLPPIPGKLVHRRFAPTMS